jgi:2-hydroxychromene-2-carboxylate isomerase
MSNVEYFYAAHSAYAYLGSAKFTEIMASAGRGITHKPVDLTRLMERWAEFRDVVMPGRPANHHHSQQ